MKVSFISDKGSSFVNEDNYLIGDNIFGVFDGATSLDWYIDSDGKTGGLLASSIAKEVFGENKKLLRNLAINANNAIKDKMISRGIDVSNRMNLWSTSAAVVRINDNLIEWLQLGDSLILVIYNDDSYKLIVEDYDHDKETLIMWKELWQKKVENIRKKLNDQILKIRTGMNIDYGILNGEDKMLNFVNEGSLTWKNVKYILLFTDGLFIPKEDPRDQDDFRILIDLFLEGGLEKIKNYIRALENQDPNCWVYPRFKQHDDIAAISITFDN
jgi:serine/threonine protein phosphatase PrpC